MRNIYVAEYMNKTKYHMAIIVQFKTIQLIYEKVPTMTQGM